MSSPPITFGFSIFPYTRLRDVRAMVAVVQAAYLAASTRRIRLITSVWWCPTTIYHPVGIENASPAR